MKNIKNLLTEWQYKDLSELVSLEGAVRNMTPEQVEFMQGYVYACVRANERAREAEDA